MSLICCPLESGREGGELVPFGWDRMEVAVQKRGKELKRVELIDLSTGKRYLDEPLLKIAFKCFLIAIGLFPFTLAYIGFQALRAPILMTTTLIRSSVELICNFGSESILNFTVSLLYEIPAVLIQGIANAVRAPFYAIRMGFAALYGIVFPLQGRVSVGEIEKQWRFNASRRLDPWHRGDDTQRAQAWNSLFTDRHSPYVFFLAYCFQSFGKIDDPQVVSAVPLRE